MSRDALPVVEFAFPGPLRDSLIAAILGGRKVATSGLVQEYEAAGEALPTPGRRSLFVDSQHQPVAVIETTSVKVVRLADVDLSHALDEGEGFASVVEWRLAHERFWESQSMREALGDPSFAVNDETPVVLERFRLDGLVDSL